MTAETAERRRPEPDPTRPDPTLPSDEDPEIMFNSNVVSEDPNLNHSPELRTLRNAADRGVTRVPGWKPRPIWQHDVTHNDGGGAPWWWREGPLVEQRGREGGGGRAPWWREGPLVEGGSPGGAEGPMVEQGGFIVQGRWFPLRLL